MVLGGGLTMQSGVPLTTLAAQQAYQNPGEVPIFGRGDLGRAPSDWHASTLTSSTPGR